MAKKKRKKRRRAPNLFVLLALALLILGFIARRTLMPGLLHRLTYRQPSHSLNNSPSESDPHEQLTPDDQRRLDELVRRQSKLR